MTFRSVRFIAYLFFLICTEKLYAINPILTCVIIGLMTVDMVLGPYLEK